MKSKYNLEERVELKVDETRTWLVCGVEFIVGGSIIYRLQNGDKTYYAYEQEIK